jgi:hypothetical protein
MVTFCEPHFGHDTVLSPGRVVLSAIGHQPSGPEAGFAARGPLPGLPSPLEIWSFLYAAHRLGAVGASLYDIEDGAAGPS